MNAHTVVEMAAGLVNNAGFVSSAQLNVDEARAALAAGDEKTALLSALRSLRYSVGIFSPVYRRLELSMIERGIK